MKNRTHHLHECICSTFGLVSAIVLLLAQTAPGAQVIQTLPFYDSFDYNPTGLASASSTVWETCFATGNITVAPGTNSSLTLGGYVPSAGSSVGGSAKATRFAGTQFTSQTNYTDGNTVYVSFLYQVTAYPTTSPGLIAFLDSTNIGNSSSAPVPTKTGLALLMDHTGHIGINSDSTTATGAQFETSATVLNTTALIVARYTFHPAGNDVVDLWVNPSSASYGAASAPASDASVTGTYNLTYLANFTISCNGNDATFGQKWDEVRIGTNWSQAVPSSNPPGSANAAHSLMTGANPTSIVADGSSTSVVKMQARDLHGINLTSGGSTVTFATTAGTISGTTDNGDGTYQATLTSSVTLGSATVTAKLGGTAIATIGTATNAPSVTVSFVPSPVSASASTAVANPITVAADGSTVSTITVTAMDDYGHPLVGQTVTLAATGSGNTLTQPGSTTDVNGHTTGTLASTVAETKTITVTIGATQINAQPTVTFTSQGVSAVTSTAVASPNTGLVADGVQTSTITVTANDGSGNPLSGQTVTLSSSGSGNILTQPSSTTDVNGQTTGMLQSTVAETKTITVTIAGTVINAQPTVAFVAGSATQIAFTSEPVTTPVGVTMPNVVVQIEDQYGNAVAQSGATVTLALSAGTLSGTNPQMTDANGQATFNDLSVQPISTGLYLTASATGFSPVNSTLFNVPPKTFYKINNSTALNLAASWTAIEGGTGPAGPPAADGVAVWDTNFTGITVDIGASASWYGMVFGAASGSEIITDTTGGHTLTLGAGSFDGSGAIHSLTMNNNIALGTDQTWTWSSNTYILTIAGSVDNGGHLLTIKGQTPNGPEKFNGAIIGNGGLTLIGSAAVTLSGTNTYSGNTTVSGGKLIINTNASIANTPSITLASGTTLDFTAATNFTVVGGQTLSGDTNGTGTATIATSTTNGPGMLILATGAQAAFTSVGNASSNSVTVGKLTVQGGTTLNGNAITINVTGVPLPAGTYTLMSATNGFTANGPFPTPTITGQGLADSYTPQIVINGQNLQLVVSTGVNHPSTSVSVTSSENPSGFNDSISFTASVQTNGVTAGDATGSILFLTNGVLFDTEGLSSGSATSAATTLLPRGANTITAEYAGDGNYLGSTNSLMQTVTNHPPVAAPMNVPRTAGQSLTIALADLATNWSDVDGDTVTLTGISLITTNNVTLTTNSTDITYPDSENVNDQFTYSISDGQGGTNVGLVNIEIGSVPTGTNSIASIVGGNPTTLTAHGVPGYFYVTQRATNLGSPVWVNISTNTADVNGVISVTDHFSDLGGVPPSSAYYRLNWTP